VIILTKPAFNVQDKAIGGSHTTLPKEFLRYEVTGRTIPVIDLMKKMACNGNIQVGYLHDRINNNVVQVWKEQFPDSPDHHIPHRVAKCG